MNEVEDRREIGEVFLPDRPVPGQTVTQESSHHGLENRRRFASRTICLPNSLEQARLPRTVRTNRLGRQSAVTGGVVASGPSSTVASRGRLEGGDATDRASRLGNLRHMLGIAETLRWLRLRILVERVAWRGSSRLLVSRQPSPLPCTPGPCPGSRVQIHAAVALDDGQVGGDSGCCAKASSFLGSQSRRSANSQPTSWTTRSIVLAETGWSPALRITRAARSNERVSAAVTTIFLTSEGSTRGRPGPSFTQREKNRGDTCGSGRPNRAASVPVNRD